MGRYTWGKKNHMTNRQVDKKTTKQLRIDAGLHKSIKLKAAELEVSIKELVERYLKDLAIEDRIKK